MNKTTNIACQDCGKELPGSVIDAGNFLYHGGKLDPDRLADSIAESLRSEDRRRANRDILVYGDPAVTRVAVEMWMDGNQAEALAAAVRHYGDMGDPSGSECERIEAAKWCHARDEALAKGTSEEWARSLCNLEDGHATPHSFEPSAVEVTA